MTAILHPHLPFGEYRRLPELNWSKLKLIGDSPLRYEWQLDHPEATGDTASRGALRAVHTLTLEPEAFPREYSVYRKGKRDKRNPDYQAHLAAYPGTTVLNPGEYDDALVLAEMARSHRVAGPIILDEGGQSEATITWTETVDDFDVQCKARLDRLIPSIATGRVIIADLKTPGGLETRWLMRQGATLGWFGQLAHYAAGARAVFPGREVEALIIALHRPKVGPPDCNVVRLTDEALEVGERRRLTYIRRLHECEVSGEWPGVCTEIGELPAPAWMDDGGDEEATYTVEEL